MNGKTHELEQDVRLLVEMGRLVSGADYLQAERYRRKLGTAFLSAFDAVDVIISPTMPLTAWKAGETSVRIGDQEESIVAVSWRLTYPWNLLGMPAVSVPCGFDRHGLPIGVQIGGPAFGEVNVFRGAQLVDQMYGRLSYPHL